MEQFLDSCLENHKELSQVKDVRPAPIPFLTEDHYNAPARAAGIVPCVECHGVVILASDDLRECGRP